MSKRVFVYDGREFPDPDEKLSVDEVRQSMVNFFPELSNAETKKSKKGDDDVYTFEKKVGSKGNEIVETRDPVNREQRKQAEYSGGWAFDAWKINHETNDTEDLTQEDLDHIAEQIKAGNKSGKLYD